MIAPTDVAVASNYQSQFFKNQGVNAQPGDLGLTDQTVWQTFTGSGENSTQRSTAGFAVIASRSERKVAFVDLQPLFDAFNAAYFTSFATFQTTQSNLGSAPDQWPYTFDKQPQATPVVVSTVTLAEIPTAVYAGRSGEIDPAMAEIHALVATMDGTLHIYDVGGLVDASAAAESAIEEIGSVAVGNNPTGIATRKVGTASATQFDPVSGRHRQPRRPAGSWWRGAIARSISVMVEGPHRDGLQQAGGRQSRRPGGGRRRRSRVVPVVRAQRGGPPRQANRQLSLRPHHLPLRPEHVYPLPVVDGKPTFERAEAVTACRARPSRSRERTCRDGPSTLATPSTPSTPPRHRPVLVVAATVAAGVAACGKHRAAMSGATEAPAATATAAAPAVAGPGSTRPRGRTPPCASPTSPSRSSSTSTSASRPTRSAPTTTWTGPILRGTYQSIQNSTISSYVDAPAGTRSVRFVLVDSPYCTQTLAGIPDFALDSPLAEGSRVTLLFGGTGFDAGTRGLEVVRFDDVADPADGGNSVRFINAAQAESAIDIYAYSGFGMKAPCTLLYDDVAYGTAGTAPSLPGDGGPTGANGYAPLAGKNLYDLTFASLGYVAHGGDCNSAFGTLYSTDGYLGQGAWTVFLEDEGSTHILCRDDGTANPLCTTHWSA